MRTTHATIGQRLPGVILACVLVGGCAGTGSDSTTSMPESTTSSLDRSTTSTAAMPTTTVSSTTTSTSGGVTIHPNLPSALSRGQIPWSEVGAGWYVVLYDSSRANPTSEADVREGPHVLYLVDRTGERYEVTAWEPGEYPTLVDATTTSAAVVMTTATDLEETLYQVVDLTTGSSSTTYELERSDIVDTWPPFALTRPSGTNVVVHRADGITDWLERRTPDGTSLSMIYEQPYVGGSESLAWLYGSTGTSLVVAGGNGILVVSNEGSVLEELWSPPDTRCEPVRWWAAGTFLAVCYGQGPGSAPIDDQGRPHTYFGRLWLLETDGSPGAPLTQYPAEPPSVVDFGYHDAWPAGDEVYLQWSGDCGAAAVATLNAEGTGDFLDIEEPGVRPAHGVRMIDIVNEQMTIYGWDSCDAAVGDLFTVDLEGHYLDTLVPVIGDSRGVTGVRGLATIRDSE